MVLSVTLPLAVASGFILALLVPLARRLLGRYAYLAFAALPAGSALLFVSLAPGVIDGEPVRWSVEWVPQLELSLSFSLDGLSMVFSLLITGAGCCRHSTPWPTSAATRTRDGSSRSSCCSWSRCSDWSWPTT